MFYTLTVCCLVIDLKLTLMTLPTTGYNNFKMDRRQLPEFERDMGVGLRVGWNIQSFASPMPVL